MISNIKLWAGPNMHAQLCSEAGSQWSFWTFIHFPTLCMKTERHWRKTHAFIYFHFQYLFSKTMALWHSKASLSYYLKVTLPERPSCKLTGKNSPLGLYGWCQWLCTIKPEQIMILARFLYGKVRFDYLCIHLISQILYEINSYLLDLFKLMGNKEWL